MALDRHGNERVGDGRYWCLFCHTCLFVCFLIRCRCGGVWLSLYIEWVRAFALDPYVRVSFVMSMNVLVAGMARSRLFGVL